MNSLTPGQFNEHESLPFLEGKHAANLLGAQAILGSTWWFLSLVIFIPNGTIVPALWLWTNLPNQRYGCTAAAYFSLFTLYALGSVIETVSFCMYLY